MVKLIWTDQAIEDLGVIGDFIAENSGRYAKLTIKKLYDRTNILKDFPRTGRIVPEKNEDAVRELIEGNYRIIYEITSNNLIYIMAVHHSAKDLKM